MYLRRWYFDALAHDSDAVESHILEVGEHPLAAMPLLRWVGWLHSVTVGSLCCVMSHVPCCFSVLSNNTMGCRCASSFPFHRGRLMILIASRVAHHSADVPRWFARGRMRIAKGRDAAALANDVDVLLVVIRLISVSSDVLLTFNRPTAFAAESQSQGCRVATVDEHEAVVQRFLASFQIVSMDIFG